MMMRGPGATSAMSDRTIWKFALPIEDRVVIDMPQGASVLSVAAQHGGLWVWALVDPAATPVARTFYVRGTGHPMNGAASAGSFVGTVLTHGGDLVWHVWEKVA